MTPRVALFAYSAMGHRCSRCLFDLVEADYFVATYVDDPAERIWFPSVAKLASERGAAVLATTGRPRQDQLEQVREFAPDIVFSFYYRHLLPAWLLDLPRLGAYNMHGSLLPRYRGRAPVNWAILRGERKTGVTLHLMTERADAGDIIDQEAVPIGEDDTAAEVSERCLDAAERVLRRQVTALMSGRAERRPQDESLATCFGRRRPKDGRIDWTLSSRRVHDLVRAVTHPYPGAFTDLGDHRLYLFATKNLPEAQPPGEVGAVSWWQEQMVVRCGGGGAVAILRGRLDSGAESGPLELYTELEKAGVAT